MSDSGLRAETTSEGVLPANTDRFVTEDAPRRDDAALARNTSITASYSHGWQSLKRYFLPLFLIGLIAFIFSGVVGGIISAFGAGLDKAIGTNGFAALANLIYQFGVAIPITYGSLYANLKAVRDEGPEVSDLFVPYRRAFVSTILTNILLVICIGVATLFLIIPGIIVGVRLSFAPFLVVDEGLGPVAAISESWRRTKGYGWTIFGMWLLAIPITLIGLILLLVGLIPAIMWIYLAFASLYAAATARRTTTAPTVYL